MTTPALAHPMQCRAIPSTGEMIPVIGCGTWENFDVGHDEHTHDDLREVFSILFQAGGSVIDSSPMYGAAEEVVGNLLRGGSWQKKAFVATKVWTQGREAGIRQMDESMALLGRVDLMQVHNLVDWRTQLGTLREWKTQGRIRYIGVTHYTASAYAEIENVLRAERMDFLQLNYSLDERGAEERLLPLAADRSVGVVVNLPFGAGRLLQRVRGQKVPPWAGEYGCKTWPQILLKFVLSNRAVTCVIPGTGDPGHMLENCAAGIGRDLDSRHRNELSALWDRKFT